MEEFYSLLIGNHSYIELPVLGSANSQRIYLPEIQKFHLTNPNSFFSLHFINLTPTSVIQVSSGARTRAKNTLTKMMLMKGFLFASLPALSGDDVWVRSGLGWWWWLLVARHECLVRVGGSFVWGGWRWDCAHKGRGKEETQWFDVGTLW